MTDGSGLIFCPWCGQSNPCGCWRKTLAESLASSLTALRGSSVSFTPPATKHSVFVSAPMMSEPRRSESEYGSWPTARANETGQYQNDKGNSEKPRATLTGKVKDWQTPTSQQFHSRKQVGKTEREPLLLGQVQQWATPTSADGGSKSRGGKRKGELLLGGQVKAWPTPRSEDSEQTGAHRGTPDTLTSAARTWPTPKSRDVKGQSQRGQHSPGDALPNMVGLQDQVNPNTNGKPRDSYWADAAGIFGVTFARVLRRWTRANGMKKPNGSLSAAWVSQLMGLPADWLDLPTSKVSELAETRSSPKS